MAKDFQQLYSEARAAQQVFRQAHDLLMPLTEALTLLPGVQLRRARTYLHGLRSEMLDRVIALGDTDQVAVIEPLPGLIATSAACDDLFFGEGVGRQRVTPRGAALLLALYERRALPCRGGLGRPDQKLCAYAASEESLVAAALERSAQREAARQRGLGFISDPSKLPEAEFECSILNEIFFTKLGPIRGSATLTIGGIEVTKSVSVYRSNSGKSQSCDVGFTWTASDGTPRCLECSRSRYAGNRRNDEKRNWGLPE
jgi:hypothetical protein